MLGSFLWGHIRNTFKRIFYAYYLRDFQVASIELLLGIGLLIFGGVFDDSWTCRHSRNRDAGGDCHAGGAAGILGLQSLAALNYDIASTLTQVLHKFAR